MHVLLKHNELGSWAPLFSELIEQLEGYSTIRPVTAHSNKLHSSFRHKWEPAIVP